MRFTIFLRLSIIRQEALLKKKICLLTNVYYRIVILCDQITILLKSNEVDLRYHRSIDKKKTKKSFHCLYIHFICLYKYVTIFFFLLMRVNATFLDEICSRVFALGNTYCHGSLNLLDGEKEKKEKLTFVDIST